MPLQPLIELSEVTKQHARPEGAPFVALDNMSLKIMPRGLTAVLGKSGSGKSTLLNLVAGLDQATKGEVTVAGQTLNGLNENALAIWRGRNVGIVFQFFQLLPTLSIVENVLLAMDFRDVVPRRERVTRAKTLLERVGIADQQGKLPATLSGGQQQRAAIARALANDPPLLLADEPTGNLDSHSAASVLELFDELARDGKTLLVVTHDEEIARRAGRVLHLQDGAIVDDQAGGAA